MKLVTQLGLALTAMIGCVGASANEKLCREAEAALSEVSVQIVEAYSSGDFDKAAENSKRAMAAMDRGVKLGKECGCTGVQGAVLTVKSGLKQALEEQEFGAVQNKLQRVVIQAEEARGVAESCWKEANSKKGGGDEKGQK